MRWASPPESVPPRREERQIAKTHVDEEAQTGVDFLENRRGNHAVLLAEGQRSEERLRVDDGQIGGVGDGLPPTVTARISGRRRLPRQSGQGVWLIRPS